MLVTVSIQIFPFQDLDRKSYQSTVLLLPKVARVSWIPIKFQNILGPPIPIPNNFILSWFYGVYSFKDSMQWLYSRSSADSWWICADASWVSQC